MSIVGGYTLDLYCDDDNHNYDYEASMSNASFAVYNQKRCYQIARSHGWIIKTKDNKAYCPSCVNRRKKAKDTPCKD